MSENNNKQYPVEPSMGEITGKKMAIAIGATSTAVLAIVGFVVFLIYWYMILVSIKPGMIGIVYEKSGKDDPAAHFIVEDAYKGIQREVMMPGWHFFFKTTMFKEITKVKMTVVPKGKVGVLIAQDGRKLREGSVLAEDDEIDVKTGKLIRMGEKGIRKKILEPGTYPLNIEYFNIELHDALDIEPGKIGILTRKIGDPPPPGQILVPLDSNYRGIIKEVVEPGIQYLHPYIYNWEIKDAVTLRAGNVGVLTRKVGKLPPPGSILVDRDSDYQGIIKEVLEPGMYYINPYEFELQAVEAVSIPDGFVGVMVARTGKSASSDQLLVDEGYRGVRKEYLKPGLYYINPYEFNIVPVDTRKKKYDLWIPEQEYERMASDEELKATGAYEPIGFLSTDGFKISVDVTVIYEILPENAPYVVATLGKNLGDVRRKIIRPGSRSFARLEGSMLKAVEFVGGETRKIFQEKLANALYEDGAKSKINILNTFVRGYNIPDELLDQIRAKEIAQKQEERIFTERKREEEQAKLARQKALVEQQSQKIKAETVKIVAKTKAQQEKEVAIIKGEQRLSVANLEREAAEQEKLKQIALGEGEARRRELLIKADNLEELRLNIYKEVMLKFASEMGKQKWVPDIIVGGQTTPSGGSSFTAISDIMNMLSLMIANQLRIQTSNQPQAAQDVSEK
jgi:regulator of protease activity HflC (stomatin/prohibitin superfamily)